jgi:hypothetical protein
MIWLFALVVVVLLGIFAVKVLLPLLWQMMWLFALVLVVLLGILTVKVLLPLLGFALVGGVVILACCIAYRIHDGSRRRKIEQMDRELEIQRRHLETVRLLQKQNTQLQAQLRDERR